MIYFLVSGSPRSGTTVFQQILNTNESISCFHEYQLDKLADHIEDLFDVETEQNSFANGIASNDHLLIPRRDLHRESIINAIYSVVSGKSNLSAVGDKLPNLTSISRLNAIKEVFPNIKLIWIIRNPINVIRSSLARAAATLLKLDSWHITTADEALDEWVRNWEFLVSLKTTNSSQLLVVKYEDIRSNFDVQMSQIASFLGVESNFSNLINLDLGGGTNSDLSGHQELDVLQRLGTLVNEWDLKKTSELLEEYKSFPYLVSSGKVIGELSGHALSYVIREGFYPTEDWGVWSSGTRAHVIFRIRNTSPIEQLWLEITYQGFTGGEDNFVFGVSVNHGNIEVITVSAAYAQSSNAILGRLYEVRDGLVDINFLIPRPKKPQQEPLIDDRTLGFGIRSICATVL